jgi:hypothetical protein
LKLCRLSVLCGFKNGNHKEHRERYSSILFEAIPPLCSLWFQEW